MAIREVGKKYVFTYQDVKTDVNGWAAPKFYRPIPFDLVTLRVIRDDKEHNRSIVGWWTGSSWEGQRLRKEDQIICWKPREKKDE